MSEGEDGGNDAMPASAAFTFEAPHEIRNKVKGGGPLDAATLLRIEAAVAEQSAAFCELVARDIDRMQRLVAAFASRPRDEVKQDILAITHEVRGQGTSFGFPLLTRIGNALSQFLQSIEDVDDDAVEVIDGHVQAMHGVVSNRISGDGDRVGPQIIRALDQAVRRYRNR
jgi:hypothetical protein